MDFQQLQRRVFAAHGGAKYEEGLALLEEVESGVAPQHASRLAFWRACLTSVAGRPAEALGVLDAALDRGLWWDPQLLERDADLDAVRQLHGWADYLQRVEGHRSRVAASAEPQLVIERPSKPVADPCPAVLVLHGAAGSVASTRPYWTAVLDAGWVLALAQSSQPVGSDAFVWSDVDRALRELRTHAETLASDARIDVDRSVLAGFSQGGALALRAVLAREVPILRFALQAPSSRVVAVDPASVDEHPDPFAVEGVVLVGTEDAGHDDVVRIVQALDGRIGRCQLEIVEGLGHEGPDDFPERLRRWLEAWRP